MVTDTAAIHDRRVIEELVIATCQKVLEQAPQGRERHRKLQSQIAALGRKLGFEPIVEYVLRYFRENQVGFLDVVWLRTGIPVVAFEIDSARRRKSLHKLLAIDAPLRLWVYYGSRDYHVIVNDIDPEQNIRVIAKQQTTLTLSNRFERRSGLATSDISSHQTLNGYQTRLARIKQEYPRAYQVWSKDDDHLLVRFSKQGMKVIELSHLFQRRPGAIRSRLKKLGNAEST